MYIDILLIKLINTCRKIKIKRTNILHVNIPKWNPSVYPITSANRSGKHVNNNNISATFTLII